MQHIGGVTRHLAPRIHVGMWVLGFALVVAGFGCSGHKEEQSSDPPTQPPAPCSELGISPDTTKIFVKETRIFVPSCKVGAVGPNVQWTSSNPAVATIKAATVGPVYGIATGIAIGTTIITATVGTWTATATLEVTTSFALVGLLVTPSVITTGDKQQFVASAQLRDGTTRDVSLTATWKSSDPLVASVDTKGLATVHKRGSVKITAESEGYTGSADLEAAFDTITRYEVDCLPAKVSVGTKAKCTATGIWDFGVRENVTDKVEWASPDTTLATISNIVGSKGEVTANKVGIAKITMTPFDVALRVTRDLEVVP